MFSSPPREDITDLPVAEANPSKNMRPRCITQYLLSDIDTKRTDVILIVCAFVGGLVDGTSFNAWGSFSSMQTGSFIPSLVFFS
jgi:Protein of unknown function (DUF1275)